MAPSGESITELPIDQFKLAFETNVTGCSQLIQALLPNLTSGKVRKIINISSDLASFRRANPCRLYGYQCSKAALNMLTVLLDKELRDQNFCCIAIHPGPVKTRLNTGGLITPDQSALAISELIDKLECSDGGKWLDYLGETVPW